MEREILIGVGSNMGCAEAEMPLALCQKALALLSHRGIRVTARAPWYLTAPVPASAQAWYCNSVWRAQCQLPLEQVMKDLLDIEASFGRQRTIPNDARELDLDMLASGSLVLDGGPENLLIIPHPRLHRREFVLRPMVDIAPNWRHPHFAKTAKQMLVDLLALRDRDMETVIQLPKRWSEI